MSEDKSKELDALARHILIKKEEQKFLSDEILGLERQVIEIMGNYMEGTITEKTSDYAISTVGKITRSVDAAKLRTVWAKMNPENRDKCIKLEPKLNLRAYREMEYEDLRTFDLLNEAITSKPAKTVVTIKRIEVEEDDEETR